MDIIDLHAAVIKVCGEPPYDTCSIMKQPRDVVMNFDHPPKYSFLFQLVSNKISKDCY